MNLGTASISPWRAAPSNIIDAALRLAAPRSGSVFVDMGCGDGAVLVAATTKFGVKSVGYELDPTLARQARERISALGLGAAIRLVEGDMRELADLSDADTVFVHLAQSGVALLEPIIRNQCRCDVVIVSVRGTFRSFRPGRNIALPGRLYPWRVQLWSI